MANAPGVLEHRASQNATPGFVLKQKCTEKCNITTKR